MYTPTIDAALREVSNLHNQITCLKLANDKLNAELKQKQESWDKAAYYRDMVLELEKQLETERMRLAAVSVVASADTETSRVEARKMHPAYVSAALGDVIRRVDECIKLRAENRELEKRINERYSDANYHMNALDRLANFVKPKDLTSAGVVSATIDWINRLLEANETAREEQARLRALLWDIQNLTKCK